MGRYSQDATGTRLPAAPGADRRTGLRGQTGRFARHGRTSIPAFARNRGHWRESDAHRRGLERIGTHRRRPSRQHSRTNGLPPGVPGGWALQGDLCPERCRHRQPSRLDHRRRVRPYPDLAGGQRHSDRRRFAVHSNHQQRPDRRDVIDYPPSQRVWHRHDADRSRSQLGGNPYRLDPVAAHRPPLGEHPGDSLGWGHRRHRGNHSGGPSLRPNERPPVG